MNDSDCVALLQWALPRLHLRWSGFRKVRRQVCRRIQKRMQALGFSEPTAYRNFLERHPQEWVVLDRLTPITISSFYRDKAVFDFLGRVVLEELAANESGLRAWSIGCASGEEPYTLMLARYFGALSVRPDVVLSVVATDVDEAALTRARIACYPASSVKHLPATWLSQAFSQEQNLYCLRPSYRVDIDFKQQDIRTELPEETFHLILCRNLVFTYYDESLQRQTLARMLTRLRDGGALVVGRRESLPPEVPGLTAWPAADGLGIYRKGS